MSGLNQPFFEQPPVGVSKDAQSDVRPSLIDPCTSEKRMDSHWDLGSISVHEPLLGGVSF